MNKEKRVFFKELEYKYANLLIRLKYDNLKQGDFFRLLIDRYLKNDINMLKMLEEHKQKVLGKRKFQAAQNDLESGRNLLEKLGISEKEKKELFDIIEKGENVFE